MTGSDLLRGRRPRLRAAALGLAVLGAICTPSPAPAQGALPILVGGASGLVAGGYVSIGVITAEARVGRYLHSAEDALGFRSLPVLIGGATGVVLGAVDDRRLYNAMLGSVATGAVGFGVGWIVGTQTSDDPGSPWAGAVIGSAAGIVLGGVVGMLLPDGDSSESDPPDRGIPLGFTIRF